MRLSVEIDSHSGFCGGVIRAISKAENFLSEGGSVLYSLGSIVHNEAELGRLEGRGLVTVGHDDLPRLQGKDVLIRAHGEPPQTYAEAKRLGINLIDCTCPVVLQLQKHIRRAYDDGSSIVIFGKVGHAEVLGLVGQVDGDALVVENMDMLRDALSAGIKGLGGVVDLFSQTTKSPSEYREICNVLRRAVEEAGGTLNVHATICSQVASRHAQLENFAISHDVVVFVAGKDSSNGKVLFDLCAGANPRTYRVGSPEDVDSAIFRDGDKVGVCGATSTPKWLLEAVAGKILHLC
ncbi:MAG: 4-hydroxy-3-methylbut-2-enyl diphosphate reductase [Bacteroidales bacterium]|nr:4-hydroxy-3-methylbut-2-enyl diphosphate reductase [Bacteroidales bacterium]